MHPGFVLFLRCNFQLIISKEGDIKHLESGASR